MPVLRLQLQGHRQLLPDAVTIGQNHAIGVSFDWHNQTGHRRILEGGSDIQVTAGTGVAPAKQSR